MQWTLGFMCFIPNVIVLTSETQGKLEQLAAECYANGKLFLLGQWIEVSEDQFRIPPIAH
jgi:hypothetical protein